MPATFPSHPAAVLPLKLRWPRRFDGVALLVGAAAPDLAYPLDGTWFERPLGIVMFDMAHSWLGVLLWGLPVTLVGCWVVRWVAPVAAAHLPRVVHDYGALGQRRPRWLVTALSALLAAASHVLWDRVAIGYADLASSIIGAAVTGWVLFHIGRRRLLREWHGDPPSVQPRMALFWIVTGGVLVACIPPMWLLPGAELPHTTIVRLLLAVVFALVCGRLAVRLGPVAENAQSAAPQVPVR